MNLRSVSRVFRSGPDRTYNTCIYIDNVWNSQAYEYSHLSRSQYIFRAKQEEEDEEEAEEVEDEEAEEELFWLECLLR